MASFVWFMLLGFCTLASSREVPSPQTKNIFILSGQSNMAGRGGRGSKAWDGIVPPECVPNPKIFRFNANLTWEEAREPLHVDIDVTKVNGIGPGMPFANKVLKEDPNFGVIGLVPCSIGGTFIAEWAKGTDHYNNMLNRTRAALADGGVLRGLLWYQGENDGDMEPNLYRSKYETLVTDFRADLQLPNLPVIQVAIDLDYATNRAGQLAVNLTNVKTIDALGQPLQSDEVHLTTQGYINVGHMLADAFLKYFPNTSSC